MLRFLFVMVITVVFGLGSGYALWGTQASHLTQALNTLTLELDTMRARLAAAPTAASPGDEATATQTDDQIRVINEGIAALRQDMANQKEMLERAAAAAAPADAAAAVAELRRVRDELAGCIADKQDLQANRTPPPAAVPQFDSAPPQYAPPTPRYAPTGTPPAPAPRAVPAPSSPPRIPEPTPPPAPGANTAPPTFPRF